MGRSAGRRRACVPGSGIAVAEHFEDRLDGDDVPAAERNDADACLLPFPGMRDLVGPGPGDAEDLPEGGQVGGDAEQLGAAKLLRHGRVAVEKPFGHDLTSANELDARLHRLLRESQILRVDHFLGKEPVVELE